MNKLIKKKIPKFHKIIQKMNLSIEMFMVDWFFCLGFKAVPLENSGYFLRKIIFHGWYYFYKLTIVIFEKFLNFLK